MSVKLFSLFIGMTSKIKNKNSSSWFEYFKCGFYSSLRANRMVEGLAEERYINRTRFYRRIFNVTQAIFQICKSIFFGNLCAKLDHFWEVINSDDLLCGASE